MIRVRSIGVGVALLVFAGAGEAQGESTVAQTVGFEATEDWQLVEGTGTLSLAPALSEGTSALLLGGAYWRRIRSGPVVFDEVDERRASGVCCQNLPKPRSRNRGCAR